jgi:hypothetical protein
MGTIMCLFGMFLKMIMLKLIVMVPLANQGDLAARGGVVRNTYGGFLFGFRGLQLGKYCGFLSIELESDSSSTVTLISNGCGLLHPCYSLVSLVSCLFGLSTM